MVLGPESPLYTLLPNYFPPSIKIRSPNSSNFPASGTQHPRGCPISSILSLHPIYHSPIRIPSLFSTKQVKEENRTISGYFVVNICVSDVSCISHYVFHIQMLTENVARSYPRWQSQKQIIW